MGVHGNRRPGRHSPIEDSDLVVLEQDGVEIGGGDHGVQIIGPRPRVHGWTAHLRELQDVQVGPTGDRL